MNRTQLQNLIVQFFPVMKGWLAKEGWQFAEWALGLPDGEVMVAMLIKDGEENLLATIKSVPEVWGQVESTYGEAHLRKWLHEVVNYKEIISKMEEEEGN